MDYLYAPIATIVIAWRAWFISGFLIINLLLSIYLERKNFVNKTKDILKVVFFSLIPLFLIWIISELFKVPEKNEPLDFTKISFPTYVVSFLLLFNFVQAFYQARIHKADLWLFLSLLAIPLWLSIIATFIALMELNGVWV